VQFNWRLLARKVRGISMAGADIVTLQDVIVTGVAIRVLSALRLVQFLSPVTGRLQRK
jgi:hypothetical protein